MFHHHHPVNGVAYIGIIAPETLIGLSNIHVSAQWCARRGTLQEELNNVIANEIQKATVVPMLVCTYKQHMVVVKIEVLVLTVV